MSVSIENAAAGTLLGEIVTWEMPADRAQGTTRIMVADALQSAGLDRDLATELPNRSAFSRAMKHMKEERIIEKVSTKKGETKFQFTKEYNDGERIDHMYEAILVLDEETGKITCHDDPSLATVAQEHLKEALEIRTASDITRLVQRLFADQADLMALNRKGCAYFVPVQYASFVTKVKQFFTSLGGELQRFPVPAGTTEGNASVQDTVSNTLAGLIEELDKAVEEWDNKTKESTMEAQKQKIEVLEFKIQAYSQYLGGSVTALQAALITSREKLIQKATDVSAIKAQFAEEAKKNRDAEKAAAKAAASGAPLLPMDTAPASPATV